MARSSTTSQQPRRVTAQQRPGPFQSPADGPELPAANVPVGLEGDPLFDPLLTADQVAHWLAKPKATLYAWRTRGQGPRGIKVGGDLRYRRRDVEAYLDQNTDPRALE